jgi:hypothetical protein
MALWGVFIAGKFYFNFIRTLKARELVQGLAPNNCNPQQNCAFFKIATLHGVALEPTAVLIISSAACQKNNRPRRPTGQRRCSQGIKRSPKRSERSDSCYPRIPKGRRAAVNASRLRSFGRNVKKDPSQYCCSYDCAERILERSIGVYGSGNSNGCVATL